jgi:hypothetical protein
MSPDDKEDVMNILKNIETIDEFDEHKKIVVDLVVGEFRVFVDAMKSLTDGSMSPEEIETKITSLEGGREKLEQEVGAELERISKIPGAEEVVLSLQGELNDQMGALTQEMAQVMMQLMGNVMGGMFGGEGMEEEGQTVSGFNFTEDEMVGYELPEGETIEVLEFVKSIKPTDDQKEKAEELVNLMEKMYKEELQVVKDLKDADISPEDLRVKVLDIQLKQMYTMSKMEKEMERLDVGDDSEYGEAIEDQLTKRVEPIMNEFFQVTEELNLKYMMLQDQGEPAEPREVVYCPECEYALDEDDNNKCSYCGLHLEDWYEGRVKLNSLYGLYQARTLDAFNEVKDGIIEDLNKDMEYDINELELIDEPHWINESQERVEEFDAKHQSLNKELEVHLNRLRDLPDAKDVIDEYEKELKEKIKEKYEEMGVHLDRIKKEAEWHKN